MKRIVARLLMQRAMTVFVSGCFTTEESEEKAAVKKAKEHPAAEHPKAKAPMDHPAH